MDNRDQRRPPRSARPNQPSVYSEQQARLPQQPIDGGSRANVSFQQNEQGDRHLPVDQTRAHSAAPGSQRLSRDVEHGEFSDPSRVGRKKSLVRPDREKIEPGHRQWHYRSHVAETDGRVGVLPSCAPNILILLKSPLLTFVPIQPLGIIHSPPACDVVARY